MGFFPSTIASANLRCPKVSVLVISATIFETATGLSLPFQRNKCNYSAALRARRNLHVVVITLARPARKNRKMPRTRGLFPFFLAGNHRPQTGCVAHERPRYSCIYCAERADLTR